MTSMSALGNALLGLLSRQSATGYDLAKLLKNPVSHFWTARHSQIYPELARLESDGLVKHTVIDGAGPRPTKRYAVTPAGRAAVRQWLLDTSNPVDPKEILLRVYLVNLLPATDAITVLTVLRDHHLSMVELFEAIPYESEVAQPFETPGFGDWATLSWGLEYERRRAAWLSGLIAEVAATLPTAG